MLRLTLAALLAIVVALPGGASAAERTRVVVYKLKSTSELAAAAAQVNDALLLHLGRKDKITVLGEAEIQVMLGHEQDKQVLGCESDTKCLANLQTMIEANKVVSGHLGKLGSTYVVTLKLADADRALVVGVEGAEADNTEDLIAGVKAAADRLLGDAGSGAPKFVLKVAPEGTKAAVVDLKPHGVDGAIAQNLTELLTLELKKFEGLGVISREEIKTMLRFQAEKSALSCDDDTSCLVEIGGALGVDYLVTGSVGKLGDSFVVTLKLMDVHRATVASRVSESVRADAAELAFTLRFATWRLLGRPLDGTGSIRVRSNIGDGQITMADNVREFSETTTLKSLPVGKYGMTLASDGYYPLYKEAYVLDGQTTPLQMQLIEQPNEWYEEWWTWAIIGGVVAAGTATAFILANQEVDDGQININIQRPSATSSVMPRR